MRDLTPLPRLLFVYRFCGLGGVETSILNKIEALRQAGIRAEVLFSEFYGEGGRTLASHPAVTVGLPRLELHRFLHDGFDAICVIDYPEFLDVLDAAGVRRPIIFETHSAIPQSLPHFYSRLGSSSIQAVVVPSEFNARQIASHGAPNNGIAVIPNPVDTDVFKLRHQPDDGLAAQTPDGPVLVWVGRLEEEKNPAEFLEIAQALLRVRPTARFVMVGDDPAYAERVQSLRGQVTEETLERVTFHRAVPYDRMPQIFSLAAATGGCLISTSLHEAQPMIFLEAMACECPVVATRVGGNPDLIEDGVTGHLYDSGDIDAALGAIAALTDAATSSSRASIVVRARQRVQQEHSTARVGGMYRQLIERLAPASTKTGPLVSGIIIFLNGDNFLEEAIESVLRQTYTSWELLLVDDGSTDRSTEIARRYAARYPGKIRYLHHDGHQNRGKSASRNLGLQHVTGAYVALLDHDDVWLPDKLEDQVAILEAHPEAGMMYGRTRYWHSWTNEPADQDRDGYTVLGTTPETMVNPPHQLTLLLSDESTCASPCSVLIRSAAIHRVGGFEESFVNIYDDVALLAKLYLEVPVYVSGGLWDCYRQHTTNSTALARRAGEWHPRRPHPHRERLLTFIEQYTEERRVSDPRLLAVLQEQLAPYRRRVERSTTEAFYDVCLDAGMAVARGEDACGVLRSLDGRSDPGLDAQRVAEEMFDAVPRSTWNAASLWLDIWPAVAGQASVFLKALEAHAGAPGLAGRALGILERMIEGKWLFRAVDGNDARLMFTSDPDSGRIDITKATTGAPWDIQLNRPKLRVQANQRYVASFRARADRPRVIQIGFSRAHDPWDNLGLWREVHLTEAWQVFNEEFVAADTDENARIHLDVGASDVSVEWSGISLSRSCERPDTALAS